MNIMTPIKLTVNFEDRSYPLFIGQKLLEQSLLANYITAEQVLIVTNETIASRYLAQVKNQLSAFVCDEIILPDGEQYKTLDTLGVIFDHLIRHKHRRNTTLIALGGGVIGDITGFAAATYQRGVNFIQVPTTLLAQVDASVGGKTAVNHPLGKNMIGAFHQPKAVVIDIDTLQTLPGREFRAGLAEIIKAALIMDDSFFGWLEDNLEKLLALDYLALQHAVTTACAIKIKIVVADEKEAGKRALLNLGHTFAHAIENLMGYGSWLHGEAVALGLILAADYSHRIGWLDLSSLARIKNILTMAQLPIRLPDPISANDLIEAMSTDKKKDSSGLKLVLLKEIGHAVLSVNVDSNILEAIIDEN